MSDSDSQSLVLIGQRPFRPCAHMAPMGLSAARPEGMPFAIAAACALLPCAAYPGIIFHKYYTTWAEAPRLADC